jgi:NADPH:quinone reductase-like Zn-dependent oxidoreductase
MKSSWQDYVQKYLDGTVDVIFDNIGGSSVKQGKAVLAPGGRIVSLGAAALSGKKGKLNLIRLGLGFGFFSPISYLGKSQSLIGVNMLKIADHRPDMLHASFVGVAELYKEGILKPHVGAIFSQQELDKAHAHVEARKSIGKIVVTW